MRTYNFSEIDSICFELRNNKAAIVETDTVMGIISLSMKKIYEIKRRSHSKKIVLLINKIEYMKDLTNHEKRILEKYWPGALTVIKNGISYRIPNHKGLLKLLSNAGPLFCSSANISGKKPIKNHLEAKEHFKNHFYDLILIEGNQLNEFPSTIVDFDNKKVLRKGSIDGNKIVRELAGD